MSKLLKLSGKTKIIFSLLVLIIGGFFLGHWLSAAGKNSQQFDEARLQGAIISQNIVDLANQSTDDIKKINELDQQKNFTQALDLTLQVINKSQDIRDQAVKLSAELTNMTQSLSGINSFEARQAALEGISSDLALLSQLISYSDYLNQLLNVLRSKFTGENYSGNVTSIIGQINAEVTAINSFNNQATQAMANFDKIIGK